MKLINAAIPSALMDGGDGLTLHDVTLDGARIAAIAPAAGMNDVGALDCAGGILVPGFVDMHTHIDKGHIWPRAANPDGTFMGALTATRADHPNWSPADLRARMDFSLRAAYAHGTVAIRTHIDSNPPRGSVSWPVLAEVREAWADRITLQASSLMTLDALPDDLGPFFDFVTAHGGIVGAAFRSMPDIAERVAALLAEAEDRGMDADFHVDETLDPESNCLEIIAQEAKRIGFSGTITCGHCCSLMAMDEDASARILDKVAETNIAIVSLPMCNQYLQDRVAGRTPRIRGGTLVHEMRARGIPVAIASDNTRDPFYAYGDLDMAEVWREATRILQLDHPVGDWPRAFFATPADIMGLANRGRLAVGAPADLVLFKARSWTELFARPQYDRSVIRNGAVIEAAPPDFSELDGLWTSPH
ncbi:cytosine deaminase [Acuticoccus kandeliae]|uniref:cytosine deaminase n=1 Tax=Acuticoccus kandeliae TaxID=2073160 RepID=UPI000D3E5E1C|nr:cytosine deaminase [Acuticoccus kandeliae]